jgi:hypothetical protein
MNEELQTNELTFQKVFTILKRSFVRILIYGLVLAILGGGITAIVTVASKGSAQYTTIIEYNYPGVEDGKDPLNNMLDTSRIKSTVVVNSALKNMGITDNNVASAYSQILIDNIAIIGFVSSQTAAELEKNKTLSYFPTRYTITLTENSKLPFKDTQYNNFLNELIKSYKQYFKDVYNFGKVLSLSVADQSLVATSDYYDICVDYKLAINELLSGMTTLKEKVTDRYNKLYSNIEVLKNEISSVESYIIGNNITKVNAPLTLHQNLKLKNLNYTKISAQYEGLATDQFTAIKEYDNSSSKTTTDGKLIDIVTTDSKYYDEMVKKYNDYISKQYNYSYQAGIVAEQMELVDGAEDATVEERARVESSLLSFDNNLKNTLDSVNAELELYSQQRITENGFNIAMSATKIQSRNYRLVIIAAIVCGFVGCIVAVAATQIVDKKKKKKQTA